MGNGGVLKADRSLIAQLHVKSRDVGDLSWFEKGSLGINLALDYTASRPLVLDIRSICEETYVKFHSLNMRIALSFEATCSLSINLDNYQDLLDGGVSEAAWLTAVEEGM